MRLFKHSNGMFLRLFKEYGSDVNMYLIVDENNIPILKKSDYSFKMMEQKRIVTGFDNLVEILLK